MTERPTNGDRHRVVLPGSEGWSIWRQVVLRGAGFPAEGVLALAAPDLARAADAVLDAEAALSQARAQALASLDEGAEGSVLRALRAGRVPDSSERWDGLRRAADAVAESRKAFSAAHRDAAAHARANLRAVAREPRLREAVIWQNRRAFEGGIEWLLRRPIDASDHETRKKERLIATYLQRYCVKNDTIGFFGPIGWALVVDDGPALACAPGPSLLATRSVSLEHWAVDAVARALSADAEVATHLPPRRFPTFRLDGGTWIDTTTGRTFELDAIDAALLDACDGVAPAAAIAARVAAEDADTAAVLARLRTLVERGWIGWGLEVSPSTSTPESALRAEIQAIGAEPVRARCMAVLDRLAEGRRQVASAAGDGPALLQALARLDETFTEVTGAGATRREGRTYGGRTIAYEDCRRDADVRIGPALIRALAPAFELLLTSARWYTHEIAARAERVFADAYERAAAESRGTVDFLRFQEIVYETIPLPRGQSKDPIPLVGEVVTALRARWSDILRIEEGAHRVEVSSPEVRAQVADAFAAPGPGWPTARHHSPDLMIAAASVEDVCAGRFLAVLGELHVGLNTVAKPICVAHHVRPQELLDAWSEDLEPNLVPVPPRGGALRGLAFSPSPDDYEMEDGDGKASRDRSHVVAGADLLIAPREGRLRVFPRQGGPSFDVMNAMQVLLRAVSARFFHVAPSLPHSPRVTLAGVVVARETWRFSPAQWDFVTQVNPETRYLAARQWARAHGLPRFAFVSIPEDMKPWFLDVESPSSIEVLSRALRGASKATVTEMLPTIHETWLRDAEGRAYTSELRIAAVDPVPFRPAARSSW